MRYLVLGVHEVQLGGHRWEARLLEAGFPHLWEQVPEGAPTSCQLRMGLTL